MKQEKVISITLMGRALMAAVDSGLVPETDDGWDDTVFLRFWESFEPYLQKEIEKEANMVKFKGNEITVFDNDNLTVIQTDPETIKIEGEEISVMIRDFRKNPIINIALYFLGALSGGLLIGVHFLLH